MEVNKALANSLTGRHGGSASAALKCEQTDTRSVPFRWIPPLSSCRAPCRHSSPGRSRQPTVAGVAIAVTPRSTCRTVVAIPSRPLKRKPNRSPHLSPTLRYAFLIPSALRFSSPHPTSARQQHPLAAGISWYLRSLDLVRRPWLRSNRGGGRRATACAPAAVASLAAPTRWTHTPSAMVT